MRTSSNGKKLHLKKDYESNKSYFVNASGTGKIGYLIRGTVGGSIFYIEQRNKKFKECID